MSSGQGQRALLERDAELAGFEAALAHARSGEGRLIVVEGQAGAGKSALLAVYRERARAQGMQVYSAIGGELERDFPFGAVRQLLEPAVRAMTDGERAGLLSGAAAAARPVVSAAAPAAAGADGLFATLHGLYWVVVSLAEQRPAALFVDDAHWVDAVSLQFVDFLARRAGELPLLVVVATRSAEPGAPSELLDRLLDLPETEIQRPAPLGSGSVRTLVEERLGIVAEDDLVAEAAARTSGNPLLLRELVRTLQETPGPVTVARVRDAVPALVRRSVARRLKALPAPARLTAHALAIAGSASTNDLVAAMTGLTQEQIDEGLRDLSAIELITGQPPRLRHPVIRTAIDESITGISRAQMHRAAAEFLHRVGAPADEVVLHVLSAPSPLPEWALAELEVGSRRAMAEGAPYVALQRIIRAYEEARAQGLGVDAVRLELGTVEQRLGLPGAVEHLQAAATSERDVVSAEALRALLALGEGLIELIDRAERVAAQLMTSGEGALATDLRASAYVACRQSPRLTDRRLTLLTTLATEQEALSALSITAFERANLGATRDEVSDRLARLRRIGPLQRLEEIEQPMIFWAVEAALGVDVTEGMHAFLDSAELLARRSGSRLAAAFASFLAANWSLATGSTESAEVRGLEALEHFTAFGATGIGSVAAATVAAALIRRDRLSEAEELLSGLTNEHLADNFEGLFVLLRRGELRLAQGRGLEAVADLRLLQELVEAMGWQRCVHGHGRPLLARALALTGHLDDAEALAREEIADAQARAVPGAEAAARLALAASIEGPERLQTLRAAVDPADRGVSRRLAAEVRFELGRALRQAGQRVEARELLVAGLDTAARDHDDAIAAKINEELMIAGARPRRAHAWGADALTASERRVAEHAARGLSNREIAETLFVTRKTVEHHLSNVFTKLEIRSRTQLAAALGLES